jgi:hypothetical protein
MRISKTFIQPATLPAETCGPAEEVGRARLQEIFTALEEFSAEDKAQAASFEDWYALSEQRSDPAADALWTKLDRIHKLLGEAEVIQSVLRWPNPEAHAAEAYHEAMRQMAAMDYASFGGFDAFDRMNVLARLGCVD